MMKYTYIVLVILLSNFDAAAQGRLDKDTISTSEGPLIMTFIGHASLMFEWNGKVIFFDPSSRQANYYKFPKASMIFVTHDHGDHCDPAALKAITTEKTKTFMSPLAHEKWGQGMVLRPDDNVTIDGIHIQVLPAYNMVHKRPDGRPFHVKGENNSYLITLGNKRIFVAGDTENTPEMKALKNIDIAFLPMNLPYTMTPEMVADAAKAFKPKILYPYHYGNTDLNKLVELMKDEKEVDVRIRKF